MSLLESFGWQILRSRLGKIIGHRLGRRTLGGLRTLAVILLSGFLPGVVAGALEPSATFAVSCVVPSVLVVLAMRNAASVPLRSAIQACIVLGVTLIPARFNVGWSVAAGATRFVFKGILVAVLFCLGLFTGIRKPQSFLIWPVFVSFLAVALISWLCSSRWDFASGAYAIILFMGPIFSISLVTGLSEPRALRLLENMVFFSILVIYIQALFVATLPETIGSALNWDAPSYTIERSRATVGGPNNVSGFIAFTAPTLASWFLAGRSRHMRRLGFLGLVCGTIVLAITQERGAFVSLIAGYLVMATSIPSTGRRRLIPLVLACSGLVLLFVPSYLSHSRFLSSWLDVSTMSRLQAFNDAREFFRVSPIFGRGFGLVYPRWWIERYMVFDGVETLVDPHNIFVMVLVEAGIVGLSMFGWFLAILWRQVRAPATIVCDRYAAIQKASVLATLASGMVFSVTSSALAISPELSVPFWTIVGLGLAKLRSQGQPWG